MAPGLALQLRRGLSLGGAGKVVGVAAQQVPRIESFRRLPRVVELPPVRRQQQVGSAAAAAIALRPTEHPPKRGWRPSHTPCGRWAASAPAVAGVWRGRPRCLQAYQPAWEKGRCPAEATHCFLSLGPPPPPAHPHRHIKCRGTRRHPRFDARCCRRLTIFIRPHPPKRAPTLHHQGTTHHSPLPAAER